MAHKARNGKRRHVERAPPAITVATTTSSTTASPTQTTGNAGILTGLDPATTTSTTSQTSPAPVVQQTTQTSTSTSTPAAAQTTTSTTSQIQIQTTTSSTPTAAEITSTVTSSSTLSTSSAVKTSSTTSAASTSSTVTSFISSTSKSTQVIDGSTNIVTNVVTLPATANSVAAAASSTGTGTSSGTAVGTVVGIVAGSLVGVVVLAGFLGYFFKMRSKDADEDFDDAVFRKSDFRRESVMLADQDDAMSMRSGSVAGTLNRAGAGAGLPGMARMGTMASRTQYLESPPLNGAFPGGGPPPMPQQFHAAPGQVVNDGFYSTMAPPLSPFGGQQEPGGYAIAQSYRQPQAQQSYADLQRSNTIGSVYPDENPMRPTSAQSHYAEVQQAGIPYHHRNLSANSYPPPAQQAQFEDLRSGSPVNANPQYYFADAEADHGLQRRPTQTDYRADGRTLSIRNGGLDAYLDREDAYGGM